MITRREHTSPPATLRLIASVDAGSVDAGSVSASRDPATDPVADVPGATAVEDLDAAAAPGRGGSRLRGLTTALRPTFPPIVQADGPRLVLADGRRLLDLTSQTMNLALGQTHPQVTHAAIRQATTLTFASSRFASLPFLELSERLAELAPPGLDAVVLKLTNGSDAVETAIKLAALHTRRRLVAVLPGAWHGESWLTLGLSSTHAHRTIAAGERAVVADTADVAALTQLVLSRDDLAAAVLDPAMVSNGLPAGDPEQLARQLRELRAACDATGTLLVFDEIQSFGWLGEHLFAAEHTGVRPDMICLAKALGGGYPIAAVLCHRDLAALLQYNDGEFTNGGHPVSCAAALATLDALTALQPTLTARAEAFEHALHGAFPAEQYERRRVGLIATVTLAEARLREVWTRRLVAAAAQAGLFVRPADHGRRVLIKPPLVLAEDDLADALTWLGQVAEAARAGLTSVQPAAAARQPGPHLVGSLLRKAHRPNPNIGYVTALLAAFSPDLTALTRAPRQQEALSRQLLEVGVPAALMYEAGQDHAPDTGPSGPSQSSELAAVEYDYIAGRSLQELLADPATPAALLNGLAMRHYELVTLAHDHGIVIGDRWPGNAIVTGHADLQLIDFDLGYSGPWHQIALLEEAFAVLQTLAAIPAQAPLRSDLGDRLTAAMTRRHGPERVRTALERLADFYTDPGRPVHAGSAPTSTYSEILDGALAQLHRAATMPSSSPAGPAGPASPASSLGRRDPADPGAVGTGHLLPEV